MKTIIQWFENFSRLVGLFGVLWGIYLLVCWIFNI